MNTNTHTTPAIDLPEPCDIPPAHARYCYVDMTCPEKCRFCGMAPNTSATWWDGVWVTVFLCSDCDPHRNAPVTETCQACGATDPATVGEREFSWGYAVSCDDPECIAEFTTPARYEPYVEFTDTYGRPVYDEPQPEW